MTLPPINLLNRDCTRNHSVKKVQFLQGQFLTKKFSVPGENFSNYLMKIIVFSQFYRSKSATLEIAYDMKIDSLLFIL